MSSPFKDFPVDLVRTVCELAAESDRKTALKLVLVSREVEHWIDPILYKFVHINHNVVANAFLATIRNSRKPLAFFQSSVKVLLISVYSRVRMTADDLAQILVACCGVRSLAIWTSPKGTSRRDRETLFQSLRLGTLQPSRLSYTLETFRGMNLAFNEAPFLHVTHLELDFLDDVPVWPLENLRLLPNLTHLAIDGLRSLLIVVPGTIPDFAAKFLTYMPESLQVLVMMLRQGEGLRALNQKWVIFDCDIRVVFATDIEAECMDSMHWWCLARPYGQQVRDWGASMLAEGRDVWESAKQVQEQRHFSMGRR